MRKKRSVVRSWSRSRIASVRRSKDLSSRIWSRVSSMAHPALAADTSSRRGSMASLSRQLAEWVAALRYEDLPPAVVDRAKGVTLHGLASVLLGSQTPAGRQAVA